MAREFCHDYMKLCEDNRVEVQECVIAAIQRSYAPSEGRNVGQPQCLNINSCALLEKTCTVLGRLLAADHTFTEVKFSDCTIPERGLKDLLEGLAVNSRCVSLDLKGNNIRAQGAEALGRMLRQNKTLQRLDLEWNCLGALEHSFAVFVDGLAINATLSCIDLRNNQITHEGAAELASALKRNLSLKHIDLRWNNTGLIGSRSLLEALQQSTGIERLDLAGNNVPNDLLMSIESALGNNRSRSALANEYSQRSRALVTELKQTKREKVLEVNDLIGKLEEKDMSIRKSTKESSQRVAQLQQSLEERTTTFNSVVSKLSLVESELTLAERKLKDTQILLQHEKDDKDMNMRQSQHELQRIKEESTSAMEKMRKEIVEACEKNKEFERMLVEAQLKCKHLQGQLHEAQEETVHLQAESKTLKIHFNELMQREKQAHSQRVTEITERKNKEVEQMSDDLAKKEKALQEHIAKQSQRHLEHEHEVFNLKAAIMKEKLMAEEELSSYKKRALAEQDILIRQLEDKVHSLTSSKEEVQSLYNKLDVTMVDIQSRNRSLLSDIEVAHRKIQGLEQELLSRRSQVQHEVEKVRLDFATRLGDMEVESRQRDETALQVKKLQKQLVEQDEKHGEALKVKDAELKRLKDIIALRDGEITWIRQESVQRAHVLQSAVRSFVQPYSGVTTGLGGGEA